MLAAVTPPAGRAQSLADIGPGNPVPGANDLPQFSPGGNTQLTGSGGFNYFTDNASPPGQTFTTRTNPRWNNLLPTT